MGRAFAGGRSGLCDQCRQASRVFESPTRLKSRSAIEPSSMGVAMNVRLIDGTERSQGPVGVKTRGVGSAALIAGLCAWCVIQSALMAASATTHTAGAWNDIETAAVILVAATISSVAGFAFAALAGIGLAFIMQDPVRVVHTIVLCSIATQLY